MTTDLLISTCQNVAFAQAVEADTRVHAGVRWLDEHISGWRSKICLDALDLSSPCDCVLGQLAADIAPAGADRDFNWFVDGRAPDRLTLLTLEAARLGFTTLMLTDTEFEDTVHDQGFEDFCGCCDEFKALNGAWTALLQQKDQMKEQEAMTCDLETA